MHKMIFDKDFPEQIGIGLNQYDNISTYDKFSESQPRATTDNDYQLWNLDNPAKGLVYLTSAEILYVTSSDNGDNQDIFIQGLDENWNMTTEVITLNGQTPVPTTKTYIRLFRGYNNNGSEFNGNIYIARNGAYTLGVPNDLDLVQAYISSSSQQTLMSQFSIPDGYFGLITSMRIGIINDGNTQPTNTDVELRIRNENGVFLTKALFPVSSELSYLSAAAVIPKLVRPKSDIHLLIRKVGRADTVISSFYNLLLIDADTINDPLAGQI